MPETVREYLSEQQVSAYIKTSSMIKYQGISFNKES